MDRHRMTLPSLSLQAKIPSRLVTKVIMSFDKLLFASRRMMILCDTYGLRWLMAIFFCLLLNDYLLGCTGS